MSSVAVQATNQAAAVEEKSERKNVLADRYKTKMCRHHEEGLKCPYEVRCMFAHGDEELRTTEMNIEDNLITEEAIKAFQRKQVVKKQQQEAAARKANRRERMLKKKEKQEQQHVEDLSAAAAAREAAYGAAPPSYFAHYSYDPYYYPATEYPVDEYLAEYPAEEYLPASEYCGSGCCTCPTCVQQQQQPSQCQCAECIAAMKGHTSSASPDEAMVMEP